MEVCVYKSMSDMVRRAFPNLQEHAPENMAPITLAYIGDTVYDLFIRAYVIHKTDYTANKLHMLSVSLVRASAQANAFHVIESILTEEELRIFKRGRNAHSTVPKNASRADYRTATGLEALVGYLFLKEQDQRLTELMLQIFENTQTDRKETKSDA